MRKFLLAGLCLLFSSSGLLLAQNKTLGVGVTTPNPNAALHVESPTGNQGFLMPRLTTAQREAMTALLTATDQGLILYDTDLATIFIWDGVIWTSTSQFTVDDPASTSEVINVLNLGLGVAGRFKTQNIASQMPTLWSETNSNAALSAPIYGLNTGTGDVAGSFRIENPASTFGALYGETNGSGPAVYGNQIGLGRGGQFQITNASNTQAALRSYTTGTGNAGFYTVDNPASDSSAIYSTTNGNGAALTALTTGLGSAGKFITKNSANTSPALFVESFGTGRVASFVNRGAGGNPTVFAHVLNTGHGIWAEHEGTNGYAAILQAVNAANPNPAVFVEALGTGPSFFAQKSQATSTGDGIFSEHLGTSGSPGNFAINNAVNPSPALITTTTGSGPAVLAENRGTTNGFAGSFANTDPANNYPAIQASSAGQGSGVRVMQTTGLGAGVDVFMQNASSSASGMAVDQRGLGHAGSFIVNNSSSGSPAVQAITNGMGPALEAATTTGFSALHARHDGAMNGNAALIEITNTANAYPALQANTAGTGFAINAKHTGTSGDAIYAEHAGAGNGSAGNFRISNGSNSASALYAATSALAGNAISASNDAEGIAFAIWKGGMQITTNEVAIGTSLATRASAYRITSLDGTTFTVDFGPVAGEVFMIFNDTAQPITISAAGANFELLAGEGKTFIAFTPTVIRAF